MLGVYFAYVAISNCAQISTYCCWLWLWPLRRLCSNYSNKGKIRSPIIVIQSQQLVLTNASLTFKRIFKMLFLHQILVPKKKFFLISQLLISISQNWLFFLTPIFQRGSLHLLCGCFWMVCYHTTKKYFSVTQNVDYSNPQCLEDHLFCHLKPAQFPGRGIKR